MHRRGDISMSRTYAKFSASTKIEWRGARHSLRFALCKNFAPTESGLEWIGLLLHVGTFDRFFRRRTSNVIRKLTAAVQYARTLIAVVFGH